MIGRIRRIREAHRLRRALTSIRREFERYGQPLDGVADSKIEAALTCRAGKLNATSLSAKTIFLAHRRLSLGHQQMRKKTPVAVREA